MKIKPKSSMVEHYRKTALHFAVQWALLFAVLLSLGLSVVFTQYVQIQPDGFNFIFVYIVAPILSTLATYGVFRLILKWCNHLK